MAGTNFPHGISTYGVPVLGSGPVFTVGNVFFVDSGAGSDVGGQGTSAAQPFATIDFAIGQCTASNGDFILVMPGHSEDITADITMDVAGVTVIGMGQGHTRPQLVSTGTAGRVTITASNCRWSGIVHVASIAATVAAIYVAGPTEAVSVEHTEIDNCRFTFDATGIEYTVMIALGDGAANSADYTYIHDNWFEAENIDGCGSALLIDDCQFVRIQNNLFTGDYNSVCIDGAAGSSACLDYIITGNIIVNKDNAAVNCMDLDDNATGLISNNLFHSALAGLVQIDSGACQQAENYGGDTEADKSAILTPAATVA